MERGRLRRPHAKLREVEENLAHWLSESALGEPHETQRQ